MFGRAVIVNRRPKGDAEKPFWISYADLMTALMVLFLVAMSVAMLAVTNTVRDIEQRAQEIARQKDALQLKTDEAEQRNRDLQTTMHELQVATEKLKALQKTPDEIEQDRLKVQRDREISRLLDEVAAAALRHPGVKVDKDKKTIDFGDRARFEKGKYDLKPERGQAA